jgi:hypothetical protein
MFPTAIKAGILKSDEIFLAHFCAAGFSGNLSTHEAVQIPISGSEHFTKKSKGDRNCFIIILFAE